MDKISVILPVLNAEKTISQCINSVIDQSANVELILIDGGSTDRTLEIVERYKKHIAYLETGKDSGIADAFNRGLRRASGEIVAILNSDDYWEPGAVDRIREVMEESVEIDVLVGWCRIWPENSDSLIKKPNLDAMRRYMSISHCAMFVRASIYEAHGLYKENYELAMDSEWVHRTLSKGVNYEVFPEVVCNMRMGGASDKGYLKALNEYRKSIIENNIATKTYANFFFLAHLASKLILKIPMARKGKQIFDKKYNMTVE